MQVNIVYNRIRPLYPTPPGAGWFLAQAGEDDQIYGSPRPCAVGGCPAFMLLIDDADTRFNQHWQLALYAHNRGAVDPANDMKPAAIIALMGTGKVFMNDAGIGGEEDRQNWISGTAERNAGLEMPRLDKLRTMIRSTHWVRHHDSKYYQVYTMDGNKNPLMKPGKVRPTSAADIDSGKVKSTDYVHNPYETLPMFCVCVNIKTKSGGRWSVSPFDNGRWGLNWMPQPLEQYSFFPLVSEKEVVLSEKTKWNVLSDGRVGNYYRRVS